MSPKRKVTVSEFDRYIPAAGQTVEKRGASETAGITEESVNAFTFDSEFTPNEGDSFGGLPVIDTVKAQIIYPDPLQPRPSPLPEAVRRRFRSYELDAFGAAREWLKLAEKYPVIAHDVRRYLSMGENMAANGQINPITGRWEQTEIRGVEKRIFRIETGEQRFWSAVLYHLAQKGKGEELTLRVSVVPSEAAPTDIATVRRQISENRKNMRLTEVLQAREIARLLLAAVREKTGQDFVFDPADEYDYFRAALRLGRVPHGVWDTVQEEFRLGQHRMRQSLEILRFPSHLLDLAHQARLSYRQLSQILRLNEAEWESAIWEVTEQNLAAEDEDDGEEIGAPQPAGNGADGKSRRPKKLVDPAELAYRGVRRFYRSAIKGMHSNPLLIQAVADNVIMDGYAEEVIDFMEDLVHAIRIRMEDETD